jgi:hypothetical protein
MRDLGSHFRLFNYLVKSGAAEDKIESFIANVSTNDVSPEKVIQYVNQLYDVSKKESIPLDQVSSYIRQKLVLQIYIIYLFFQYYFFSLYCMLKLVDLSII